MITTTQVDAALDTVPDDEDAAHALADLLDDAGEWDWSDGSEHDPSDRLAVLESSGAYWLVYRGTEGDSAYRYSTRDEAWDALRDSSQMILGSDQ